MKVTSEQRQIEFAKYRKAYAVKTPRVYKMGQWRIDRFEVYLKSIKHRGYVNMLDVGCGRGQAMDLAKQQGFVIVNGVEVVDQLCDRVDVTRIQGAHELPFDDDSYDLVVATDVMEHILPDDVPLVLSEMFRVARKAVHLTISHKGDNGRLHVCIDTREWWLEEIRKATDKHIRITVESDELTPPIKLPCTHLEVCLA